MHKKLFLIFFNTMLLLGLSAIAFTQQPPKKPVITPVVKFKPPVVKTFLAKFTGITATCTAEVGKQIITLPLRIADEKNETYKISSYQFAYKRIGVTEDEETGKLSPQSDMVAQRFTETPLPELWKSNIIEQLHKGEELYFFDIIMLDKTGRLFFAPDLKITIE